MCAYVREKYQTSYATAFVEEKRGLGQIQMFIRNPILKKI